MNCVSNNISSNIFFGDEVDNLGITGLHTVLPAPTVFTGQRLSGSLLICQYSIEEPVFDVVQLVLKGMSHGLNLQLLARLNFSRESKKSS
jgi:hypothetical protein